MLKSLTGFIKTATSCWMEWVTSALCLHCVLVCTPLLFMHYIFYLSLRKKVHTTHMLMLILFFHAAWWPISSVLVHACIVCSYNIPHPPLGGCCVLSCVLCLLLSLSLHLRLSLYCERFWNVPRVSWFKTPDNIFPDLMWFVTVSRAGFDTVTCYIYLISPHQCVNHRSGRGGN